MKQFDIALTVHEIDAIHDQWQLAKLNFEKASDAEIEKATEIQRLEANIQKGRQRMIELDEQIAKQQSVLLLVTEQLEKLEGERQLFQERQKNSAHQQSQLQERLAVIEEKVTELQKLQQKTTRVIAEKKDDIELAKHALHEKNEQLIQFDGTVEKEIEQLKNKYIERLNGRTSLKNERHFINKQLLQLEARLEKLEKDDEKYIVQKETVEQQLQKKEASRETLEKEQSEQSKVIQEMQNELQYVKNQLETKQSKLFQTYHKIQKAKAREESLEAMSREFTGYFQGVKEVLKAKNEQRLHGIEGPVVDLIRVEKQFETAVDTALGGTAQHVVVQDEKMGRNAIHFLKENQLGRATFLPMTVIKGKQLHNQQQLLLRNHPAFIGVADELVSYEQKYDGVIKHLLGNIVVALHLQGANELAKLLQYRVRIVTLNGEVIHPGGAMTGGATIRKRSSLVGRKRELEQLREKITVMESEMELLSDEVDAYQLRITTQQKELSTLQNHYQQYERKQHQLEAELTRLTISLDHAIEQLTHYELEKEELLSEHDQLVKRRDEIAKELSETENEIAQLNITIESLTGKQSEEQSSKERLSNDINELTAKLAVFNEQLTGANVELARLQNEWVDADKRKQELLQQLHMLKQVDEQLSEIELERQITKQQFAKDEDDPVDLKTT